MNLLVSDSWLASGLAVRACSGETGVPRRQTEAKTLLFVCFSDRVSVGCSSISKFHGCDDMFANDDLFLSFCNSDKVILSLSFKVIAGGFAITACYLYEVELCAWFYSSVWSPPRY
jgi:hypothetical protein